MAALEAFSGRFPGTAGGFAVVLLSIDFAFESLGDFVLGEFVTSGGTFRSLLNVEAAFVEIPGFFVSFRGVFGEGAGTATFLAFSFSDEGSTAGSADGLRDFGGVKAFKAVFG